MSEFRFAYPLLLLLLLVPPGLYFIPRFTHLLPVPGTMLYSDVRLMAGLITGWRLRSRWLPDVLRLISWILLVIAVARPQTGQGQEVIRGHGVDIVLVLDISNSMAALDFEPLNRLEAARSVLADFISRREFDRIGLVVFARNAFQQAPLTLNYPVLLQLLGDVRLVADITSADGTPLILDGTAIGLGIASAANMLRSSNAASKVIILLTDGANNAALDPLQAAAAVAALNIRVYTIGMGRPGMVTIPDRAGNLVTVESDLDEDALRNIARTGDGLYFRAEDTAGLQQIYEQINTLEQSDMERRIVIRWRDRAMFALIPALILLIAERLLRRTLFQTLP